MNLNNIFFELRIHFYVVIIDCNYSIPYKLIGLNDFILFINTLATLLGANLLNRASKSNNLPNIPYLPPNIRINLEN